MKESLVLGKVLEKPVGSKLSLAEFTAVPSKETGMLPYLKLLICTAAEVYKTSIKQLRHLFLFLFYLFKGYESLCGKIEEKIWHLSE